MHLHTLTLRDSQIPINLIDLENNICTNGNEIKQRLISRY